MSRNFRLAAIVLLFFSFVLLFLVSISLPFLTAIDFTRVHSITGGPTVGKSGGLTEVRFGSWAICAYSDKDRICGSAHHAYTTILFDITGKTAVIGASWTRGLAIHPLCAGVAAIAFGLALTSQTKHKLYAALVSALAAVLTLIAFAIDIALWAHVKHEMGTLSAVKSTTTTAPAFWMTFASLVFLIASAPLLWIVYSSDDEGGSSYAMSSSDSWWNRFRK